MVWGLGFGHVLWLAGFWKFVGFRGLGCFVLLRVRQFGV